MNEFRIRLRMQHYKYTGDSSYHAINVFNKEIITYLNQHKSIDPKDEKLYNLPYNGYYLEEFLERIE